MRNFNADPTMADTGKLTLALGTDGSGKSTFLRGLTQTMGMVTFEQTSSLEARQFKEANLDTPVTATFIDERERIFLHLNDTLEATIEDTMTQGKNIATSGGRLITLVSHQLMRVVIGEAPPQTIAQTVETWLADGKSLKPDIVALIHAPDEVIQERIMQRQKAGDPTEAFIGFNSLPFLQRYQDTWHQVADILQESAPDMHCLRLNSVALSQDEMLAQYVNHVAPNQTGSGN